MIITKIDLELHVALIVLVVCKVEPSTNGSNVGGGGK